VEGNRCSRLHRELSGIDWFSYPIWVAAFMVRSVKRGGAECLGMVQGWSGYC